MKHANPYVHSLFKERVANEPHRTKVTLVWNTEDVVRIFASMFGKGEAAKYLEMPASHYATLPYEKVSIGGKMVGVSTYSGFNANERSWLSLAMIDGRRSTPGTQVVLTWGEEDGGSPRPVVERHAQTEVRATVALCHYSAVARNSYRS